MTLTRDNIKIAPLKIGDRQLKISVVSPTYNHAPFLRQNLDAILSQTYTSFEVIIVNDGSTDGTHDILSEYAAKDSRVTYHRFEKNQGMMSALHKGYSMATGDLICPVASDDYFTTPQYFQVVAKIMKESPHAAGVVCLAELVSTEMGKKLGVMGGCGGRTGFIPPREFMQAFMAHQAVVPGVSTMLRRDLIDMVGGYPAELGPQNDYFVNHALAGLVGFVFLSHSVCAHRMSTASVNAATNFPQKIKNYALVEKKMRGLHLFDGFNESQIQAWREVLVDSMMSLRVQGPLFQALKKVMATPDVLFWMHLPDAHREFLSSIPKKCDELENESAELKKWAMEEFKRIVCS
jgi:glycosyltransferase involved in cell wall biosynthesis